MCRKTEVPSVRHGIFNTSVQKLVLFLFIQLYLLPSAFFMLS